MLTVIKTPTVIESVGNKPKRIEENVGRINSATETLSIAKMVSAAGCEEPGLITRTLLSDHTFGSIGNSRTTD
jgi:hypothetical protein